MTLIRHTQLDRALGRSQEEPARAILIGGESYLVRNCLDTLKNFLLKEDAAEFGLETMDGKTSPMGDIVEQATTFSFLMSQKVVVVKDCPLFAAQAAPGEIRYSASDLDLLTGLVEKGMPEGHYLVLTAPGLDRRKKIFKALDNWGWIIDCTVPQGVRKADLDAQRAVLEEIAANTLKISGKTIEAQAFSLLLDLTGFNPDLFARNLEKLEDFSGNARTITPEHVRAVVKRDKKDPIFNLTNALTERNPGQTLFYLSCLFTDGFHPLQILKSFENQVRKLLLVKSFAKEFHTTSSGINPGRINFNGFKQRVMPAIAARDERVKQELTQRDACLEGEDTKKSKGKKPQIPADLLLAPNPKSPYPVFQNFQKSVKFTSDELRCALMALGDLDHALKSSGIAAREGIESFVIRFCRKGGFASCSERQK